MIARVISRMDALVNRAKIAVCKSVLKNTEGSEDPEYKLEIASAITNEVFREDPQPQHVEKFDMDEIVDIARNLISKHPGTREIAVQSVRVMNAIRGSKGEDHFGMDLLEEFGHELPDSPNPESYEKMIEEYEIANGVESSSKSETYSSKVNDEMQNLREEKPWYLWPFRILFWAAIFYGAYWIFT